MDSDSMTPGETSGCQPGAGSFETDANTPVGRVHEPAAVLPSLPPDVWGAVARAAFEAEGGTIVAWIRCSLVNRAWRDELRGVPCSVAFCGPISPEQVQRLRSTAVPLSRVTFHLEETQSHLVMDPHAMAASKGTLQELRNIAVFVGARKEPHECAPTSLEHFSALRAVTVLAVREYCEGSLPALPTSLQALTLDGSWGQHMDAPSWLAPAHLTRLTSLTLAGYTFSSEIWWRHNDPPLPASLQTLHLETRHPTFPVANPLRDRLRVEAIDLGVLLRPTARLAAAAGALLSARCHTACCALERPPGKRSPGAARFLAHQGIRVTVRAAVVQDPSRPIRPVSGLPDGFGAFELHVTRIRFTCSVTLPVPGTQDAARELCLFFGRAPPSYRRFRVYWSRRPLQFEFWQQLAAVGPAHTEAECDSVKELAECMQDYAGAHDLSVAVVEEPSKHLLVVRL